MHIDKTAQLKLQQLLKKVRMESGLKQSELAAKLKKPQSFVSKYEAGERRLDILEVRAVSKALGTTLLKFVSRIESAL